MKTRTSFAGASALVLGLCGAQAAYAETQIPQTAAAGPAEEQSELTQSRIEEIIVTARRVEEDMQSVPVSITAFSAEGLTRSSVTSLADITRIVPAVRFQGAGSILATEVSIRGLGRAAAGTGGPAVQIYFNDVPIQGSPLPAYDVANLQVLKGPQGTLFGRNTIGGAILINSAMPSNDFDGYVKARYGRFDEKMIEGAVNLPVTEGISLRIAGQLRRRDPYTENLGTGPDFDDVHSNAFRVSLLLEPAEGIRNTTIFDYFEANEIGPATIAYGYNALSIFPCAAACANAIAQAIAIGTRKTYSDVSGPFPYAARKFYSLSNTTEIDAGAVTLKNIFGYRNQNQAFRINNDGTNAPILAIATIDHTETVTDEFQLLGSVFDDRLSWIVGGFYGQTRPAGVVGNPVPLPAAQTSIYLTTTNKALFANLDLKLTSKLTLSGGFRYTWDEQRSCSSIRSPSAFFGDIPSFSECKAFAASPANTVFDGKGILQQKSSAPTWSIGLNYQASDDLFLYAVTRRGYRSGGLNLPIFETACTTGNPACDFIFTPAPADGAEIDLRPFQRIESEYLTDEEIGIRSDLQWGGWRQRINLSAFHYTYSNVLALLPVNCQFGDPGCPAFPSVGFNSGKIRAYGLEGEIVLQPSDTLSFTFSASYIDAKQTEPGAAPPGVGPPGFGAIPPANLGAPRFAGTAAIRYTLPIRPLDGAVTLNADIFHTSAFDTQNTTLPGYEVANARLDWDNIGGKGLTVSLFVRNLLDKNYINSPSAVERYAPGGPPTLLPYQAANFGEPRTYGLELTYRWGR